jgi:hypothetical protein
VAVTPGASQKGGERCQARLTRATIEIAAQGLRVSAVLSRAGVVYAKGVAIRSRRSLQILMVPRRKIVKGTYLLTLTSGKHTTRERIAIA